MREDKCDFIIGIDAYRKIAHEWTAFSWIGLGRRCEFRSNPFTARQNNI